MMREIARGTNGPQTPPQGTNEPQTPPQGTNGASITGPQETNGAFNGDLSTAKITNPAKITFDDFVRGITEDRTKAKEFLKSLSNEAIISNLSKLFENPFGYYEMESHKTKAYWKAHWSVLGDALNAMEETTKQRILNDDEIISAINKGVDKYLTNGNIEPLKSISFLLHDNKCGKIAEKIFQDRQKALEKIATKYFKDDVYYIVSKFADLVAENNLTELKASIQNELEKKEMQNVLAKKLCELLKKYYTTDYKNMLNGIEEFSSFEKVKDLLERDNVKEAFKGRLNNRLDILNFTDATKLLSIIEKYELEDLTKVVEEKFKLDDKGDNEWFRKLSNYICQRISVERYGVIGSAYSFLKEQNLLAKASGFFSKNEKLLAVCHDLFNEMFRKFNLLSTQISEIRALGLANILASVIRGNNLIGDLRENILDSLRKGSIKCADIKLSFITEYKLGGVEIAKLQEAIGSYLTSCADNTAINEMTDDRAKEIRLFAEKHDVDLKPFHRIINELELQEQLL